MTHTYSGGRDQTAVIGHAPEDRNWKPGDRAHKPFICSGARIEAFVTVDAGTKRATHIGRRTWLMKHVHVGHDAYIGEDCEIAPGAVICGWVVIGNGVKIGVNASILPHRKVGDGARIGAGAVVTKDVRPGAVVAGNPARELGGHKLVRIAPEILDRLQHDGESPVMLVGAKEYEDGTYDLTLRRPADTQDKEQPACDCGTCQGLDFMALPSQKPGQQRIA
jgi:acetyltransferase-like isoleucine patch superfamily enzyme